MNLPLSEVVIEIDRIPRGVGTLPRAQVSVARSGSRSTVEKPEPVGRMPSTRSVNQFVGPEDQAWAKLTKSEPSTPGACASIFS